MGKKTEVSLRPSDELIDRFTTGWAGEARVGIAVSGGPDSLALLLLAAAARPGMIEAATVDHGLRPESRGEAEMVAGICAQLDVPHQILTAEWKEKPTTAKQERARAERYRLLGNWAKERDLRALATAHHLDDQVETFMMRLMRGAGVRGLSGVRAITKSVAGVPVVRPLLGWRHSELEKICKDAGLKPVSDPSNEDDQFERTRVRRALAKADWLDPAFVARSVVNLARADRALRWATDLEWERAVKASPESITYRPTDAPSDIRRRVVRRSVMRLTREGGGDLRGRELDRLLAALDKGQKATLRGVLCTGGKEWKFVPAPKRSRPVDKLR